MAQKSFNQLLNFGACQHLTSTLAAWPVTPLRSVGIKISRCCVQVLALQCLKDAASELCTNKVSCVETEYAGNVWPVKSKSST